MVVVVVAVAWRKGANVHTALRTCPAISAPLCPPPPGSAIIVVAPVRRRAAGDEGSLAVCGNRKLVGFTIEARADTDEAEGALANDLVVKAVRAASGVREPAAPAETAVHEAVKSSEVSSSCIIMCGGAVAVMRVVLECRSG